mgnify:CR=1 FL=1
MNNRRTAASIRRSYTGARSRAEGAGFESIIDNACAYYRSIGLADIEKTPEPMRPIGSPDRAGRFLACYTTTRAFSKAEEPSILKQSTLTVTG